MAKTLKLSRLYDEVINTTAAYAKAYNEHQKKAILKSKKDAAKYAISQYNTELAKETFKDWNSEGNPVLTGIRSRVINTALKCQYKTDEEDYMTPVIGPYDYQVSLYEMHAVLGSKIFNDPKWVNTMERIAWDVFDYIRKNNNNKTEYKTESEIEVQTGDVTNIQSMIDRLQEVFDAILFVPDKDDPDKNRIRADISSWGTLREQMTKRSGVGKVEVCNPHTFSILVLEAMHVILTGGEFLVEAEGASKKKDESEDEYTKDADAKDQDEKDQDEKESE